MEEGGSPEEFSKSFFEVLFKNFLDMFWGSFRGVKTYSEQKRFMGQNFYEPYYFIIDYFITLKS